MATWDDVRRIALALPETSERTSRELRQWRVKDKLFTWERPLRRADREALGDAAAAGGAPRPGGGGGRPAPRAGRAGGRGGRRPPPPPSFPPPPPPPPPPPAG